MSHDMSEGISWPSHTLSSPLSPVQGTPSPEHIVYYAANVKSPEFLFSCFSSFPLLSLPFFLLSVGD